MGMQIKDLRKYLDDLPEGDNYVIIGNKPYAKGCYLLRKASPSREAKLILATRSNEEMASWLTDPSFDLDKEDPLPRTESKSFGLGDELKKSSSIQLLAQEAEDHGREFLEMAQLLIPINTKQRDVIEIAVNRVRERKRG